MEVKRLVSSNSISTIKQSVSMQFDIIQQICWVLYFWYENQVFLARIKLFGFDETKIDFLTNITWVLGDTACFISDFLRYFYNYKRREIIEKENLKNFNVELHETPSENSIITDYVNELKTLTQESHGLKLNLAIVSPLIHVVHLLCVLTLISYI